MAKKGSGSKAEASAPRTRLLTIVAQDPSVRVDGRILRARAEVPAEDVDPGPCGYRVQVLDLDASTSTYYPPQAYASSVDDPFENATDDVLLADPGFHAQNVYAIVMRTLASFEYALGRRVAWSFPGHQLKVAPHAFAEANAFYSSRDEGLFFGYFPARGGERVVYSCLSHDVVSHETTHAILDGLRSRYTDPSSSDQAAFHEGFADVVALLSVFSLPEIVGALLNGKRTAPLMSRKGLEPESLRETALFGMAEEMGQEMLAARGGALRRSIKLPPSPRHLADPEFEEPHRRGEIFVAAMLNAFVRVWSRRSLLLGEIEPGLVSRARVVDDGATVADHLLTIAIRALDYAPPVDLQFGDYLSALLTADQVLHRDDRGYRFRETIRQSFAAYDIRPAADHEGTGAWAPVEEELARARSHFEPLQRDPDEVFRFVWENRRALELYPGAYQKVVSVRPCVRQGQDGFFLRETVAEYVEVLRLRASELSKVVLRESGASRRGSGVRLRPPEGMPPDQEVALYGGGALIFDEFGRVTYHVKNRIDSPRQQARLDYLWANGFFSAGSAQARRFASIHLQRALARTSRRPEAWT